MQQNFILIFGHMLKTFIYNARTTLKEIPYRICHIYILNVFEYVFKCAT